MIELHQLSKSFGRIVALNQLSFTLETGTTVALLGPNGSGKSTLLRCCAGLIRPDSGSLTIDDNEFRWGELAIRKLICYLPQTISFPPESTGFELIRLYANLFQFSVDQAVERLTSMFHATALEQSLGSYSAGMLQQLGLGLISLSNAPYIFLDEPTASLDPEAASVVREWVMTEKKSGRTILFCTHDLADVEQLADRIIVMTSGQIVADTKRSQLATIQQSLGATATTMNAIEWLYRNRLKEQ